MLNVGDTFLLPPKVGIKEHLWIVLTPADSTGSAICVNVTSDDPDHTTELNVGDHPFIDHPSFVRYRDARPIKLSVMEAAIKGEIPAGGMVCTGHKSCSTVLLKRIQEGLLNSPHTHRGIKARCAADWGLEWPPKKPK